MNILFICSRNQWRSPTGEAIYKRRQGLQVRSAGTEPSARVRASAKLVQWADLIFVMEKRHKQRLSQAFPDDMQDKSVVILDIPDDYQYMDEELISLIESGVAPYLATED